MWLCGARVCLCEMRAGVRLVRCVWWPYRRGTTVCVCDVVVWCVCVRACVRVRVRARVRLC